MILTFRQESPLQVITVDIPPRRLSVSIENDMQMMDYEPLMCTETGSYTSRLDPLSSAPSRMKRNQSNNKDVDDDPRKRFSQMVSSL